MEMFFRVLHSQRFILVAFNLVFFQVIVFAQNKINWISFEEAMELHEQTPKKMLIDLYTDWCGWCKQMDNTTFNNPVIIEYINENYIPVKFNAEQKEMIEFKGKTYEFVKQGKRGYHELALTLTSGQLSYPTYVFLTENLEVIQPLPGYHDEIQFEMIINYFGEDFYKNTPWNKFKDDFKPRTRTKLNQKTGYHSH